MIDRLGGGTPEDRGRGDRSDGTETVAEKPLAGASVVEPLSGLPDSTFVIGEDGGFLWWNDAVPSVTGYGPERVAEMDAVGLVAPEHRDEATAAIERVAETGRVGTIETEVLTADGERIPTEFKLSRVSFEGDHLVVGTGRNVAERRERRRDLRLYETAVEAAPDSIYALDADHRFRMVNERFAAAVDVARADLLGEHISVIAEAGVVDEEVVAEAGAVLDQLADGDRDSVRLEADVETADGKRHVENNFALVPSEEEPGAIVNVARDVTDRVERERELERRYDELATLDDVNVLVQETIRALVGATDRDEIERTVCERLAASPRYRAVWTTERVSGTLEPRTVVGASGYVEAIAGLDTTGEAWRSLVAPVTEQSVVVAPDLASPDLPEGLRTAAREHDVGSGIAIPLTYGEVVYGALVVNAAEPDAFSRRERAAFETLGRAMGLAVNAARHRRLTFADEAVELVFRASEADGFFIEASGAEGCRVDLEGMVPAGEDTVVAYLAVEGAPPERVASWAAGDDRVEDCRVVESTGDAGVVEAVLADSPAKRLHDTGATVRRGWAEDGVAEVAVEIAPGEDVREVVETVTEGYEGVEFVGRRDVERSGSVGGRSVGERLTDRQRTVLRAAHLAGYYDWPRGSTAEEVAEALGITPPTLHQHLRAAESKLVAAFFEGSFLDT